MIIQRLLRNNSGFHLAQGGTVGVTEDLICVIFLFTILIVREIFNHHSNGKTNDQ